MPRNVTDSVYRDAVTKLRILLQASEEAAAQVASSSAGSVLEDESDDDDEEEEEEKGFTRPSFARSVESLTDSKRKRRRIFLQKKPKARRSLFSKRKSSTPIRHNSWHNLIQVTNKELDDDDYRNNDEDEDLKSLVEKQDIYIAQLEAETKFCREQLATTLSYVKQIFAQHEIDKNESEDALKNIVDSVKNNIPSSEEIYELRKLKAENLMLRQKLESLPENLRENEERLQREISVLTESLTRLRNEAEEVSRREAEAVEQVKRSVEVAEQVRLEKTDLEFEINQLKMQVDRQQSRIRSLIEEQVVKLDEERELADRRYQQQLQQLREETETQAGDVGRLTAEVEKRERLEAELRKNLSDRDRVLEQIRHDFEKRIGELQLETVAANTQRQRVEQDLNCTKLDLESARHELKAEKSRYDSEIKSLRARLSRTEELLTAARSESLTMAEANASLERELNLLKMQLDQAQKAAEGRDNVMLRNFRAEVEAERRNHRNIVEKLEELVQRQSRVIGELKNQCSEVTDKLEQVSGSFLKERRIKDENLSRLNSRLSQLEIQTQDYRSKNEILIRRISELETDIAKKSEDLRAALIERDSVLRDKNLLNQELNFLHGVKMTTSGGSSASILRHRRSKRVKSATTAALSSSAITIKKLGESSPHKLSN